MVFESHPGQRRLQEEIRPSFQIRVVMKNIMGLTGYEAERIKLLEVQI